MDSTESILTPGVQSSSLKEINCVLHWFQTWSPRQRKTFLDDLVQKALPSKVEFLLDSLSGLNMNNHSPSIFDCQLRLFGQWFEEWSIQTRNFMVERLESCDPTFVEQFYERVRSSTSFS